MLHCNTFHFKMLFGSSLVTRLSPSLGNVSFTIFLMSHISFLIIQSAFLMSLSYQLGERESHKNSSTSLGLFSRELISGECDNLSSSTGQGISSSFFIETIVLYSILSMGYQKSPLILAKLQFQFVSFSSPVTLQPFAFFSLFSNACLYQFM